VHCEWAGPTEAGVGPTEAGAGPTEAGAGPEHSQGQSREQGGEQRRKVIYSWAVHYSRRRQLAAEVRARRANARLTSRRWSLGQPYGGHRGSAYANAQASPPASAAEAEAEKTVRLLSQYATAARAEAVWAGGTAEIAGAGQASGPETGEGLEYLRETGWLEPLTSTWSWPAFAALVIPALILLVVCLA